MSDQEYGGQEEEYGYEGGGYDEPMPGERSQSNVLGVVGFVLAFCVSPVGLLVSLIALMKRPRGFAIGGVVVGLLGTVIWGAIGAGVYKAMPYVKMAFEGVQDYSALSSGIEGYRSANGSLPASLDDVTSLTEAEKTDPWGLGYRFEASADGSSWTIVSAGFDGQFDTDDDLLLTDGMAENDVGEAIGESVEAHFKSKTGN